MPIRPELRKFYGATWRNVIRPRILARAKNKCEQCGKPNGEYVYVYKVEGDQYWTKLLRPVEAQRWTYCLLGGTGNFLLRELRKARRITVRLQVCHLNHTPGDDRDENLRALCGYCHLHYDQEEHRRNRARRKDLARPVLREIEEQMKGAKAAQAAFREVFG